MFRQFVLQMKTIEAKALTLETLSQPEGSGCFMPYQQLYHVFRPKTVQQQDVKLKKILRIT